VATGCLPTIVDDGVQLAVTARAALACCSNLDATVCGVVLDFLVVLVPFWRRF
jgi:hypothetical protein